MTGSLELLSSRRERGVDLERAIIRTVAYADIFDYPLTEDEIHRYLIDCAATPEAVRAALASGPLTRRALSRMGPFVTLVGRESVVETRTRRATLAAEMWPVARHYGVLIARLPLVRMVAVTGALAVDNVDPGADIDYLIVTATGRLWLCRALVIGVVRLAARRGHTICPNYLITDRVLEVTDRNLFTAREIAQMVPLAGPRTYQALCQANPWTRRFLPNARPVTFEPAGGRARLRPLAERLMQSAPGGWLDRWEMERKMRKFAALYGDHAEATFSPDRCKGHFDGHEQRILEALDRRLTTLEPMLAEVGDG